MATDLRPCDIQEIQNFMDAYNGLLESDFRYIKSVLSLMCGNVGLQYIHIRIVH